MCLSLKNFPCLPNDVVNQKIIKNHLGCNPLFFPTSPLPPLLAGNSEIYVFSCTLSALDNSGTPSRIGTPPGLSVPSLVWTLHETVCGCSD